MLTGNIFIRNTHETLNTVKHIEIEIIRGDLKEKMARGELCGSDKSNRQSYKRNAKVIESGEICMDDVQKQSNLKKGQGTKGSKLLIQHYINNRRADFNHQLLAASPSLLSFLTKDLSIQWESPLRERGYKEYRNDFLDLIEQWNGKREQLEHYWPRIGPQWDGIAIAEGKAGQKGLILVEAKAHTGEMNSKQRASDVESRALIQKRLTETQKALESEAPLELWENHYYQLANRLAYLSVLNEKLGIPTWLVIVNFVNDTTYIPTQLDSWIQHYQKVFEQMDIRFKSTQLLDKLITIFPQGI